MGLVRAAQYQAYAAQLAATLPKGPYAIHAVSGANWCAYALHERRPGDGLVLESGPIEPSLPSFCHFLASSYNVHCSE